MSREEEVKERFMQVKLGGQDWDFSLSVTGHYFSEAQLTKGFTKTMSGSKLS